MNALNVIQGITVVRLEYGMSLDRVILDTTVRLELIHQHRIITTPELEVRENIFAMGLFSLNIKDN